MVSPDPGSASTRWSQRFQQLPSWLLALLVVATLAGVWILVFASGGTRTAWPHAFYLPIVLAALPFGVTGGLVTGIAAAVLCGPAMPLDVATGEAQELSNWLARGGFFVAVGALSGSSTAATQHRFEDGLARRLRDELTLSAAPSLAPADAAWAARVVRAIDLQAFRSVFQPIYSLREGRLLAVEALTRFDTEPLHPPDVWFDHAHRAGLGLELELATLQAALASSVDLDEDVAVSFNASPQLLVDPRLLALLDRYEGRALTVEVTEHAVIEDYREVAAARAELRARGVQVAVDDAGAGFASLRHIVMLQPDVIKLDTSLTQDLRNDPVRGPLADALLQFAERTGSRIVVEGIETPSDLSTWRELGAHAGQGYLLARPGRLPFARRCEAIVGRRSPARSEPADARP